MKKLTRFLTPYRFSIALVLLLVFCQIMAELQLPNLMSEIVNLGVSTGDTQFIIRTGGFMLVVALFSMACSIAASYFSAKNAMGAARDLRNAIFQKVESFSQAEFDNLSTASLITRTTNDAQQMQMVVMMAQRMAIGAPISMIGAIINAWNKDVQLMKVIAIAIPFIIAVIAMVQTRAIPLFSIGQKLIDRLNQVLREGLSGVRVVRAFGREEYQSSRFNEANFDLTGNNIKVQRIMAAMMPCMMLVINSAVIAVVWIGAHNIDDGFLQIGDLMAFTQYMMTILFSLMNVSMMFVMAPRVMVSARRIVEVLDTECQIQNPEIPTALPVPTSPERGLHISFEKVTFRYPGGEHPALEDISFEANPGETVAIIGSTGSGKTTIANCILRFFDVESGTVKADGIDIRKLSLEELRSKIGYIPQRAVLFSGTIAENLLYGNDTASEEERFEALAIAQAEDFVTALADKEDSFVAQNGNNFSGGQKQRLAIARALVRRPRLLIFDDSFSALDFKTDVALRQALHETADKTTKIVIAQRVSTIMQADCILVLNEGKLVGRGTHQELLQDCRVYKEIVRSQLSEAEIA